MIDILRTIICVLLSPLLILGVIGSWIFDKWLKFTNWLYDMIEWKIR